MKYLTNYIEEPQRELFNRLGAFWAYGNDQLKEGIDKIRENGILLEGEKVVSIGMGGYCPKKNAKEIFKGLDKIASEGMRKDLEENGKDAVILRELYNYECFYVSDPSEAINALMPYGITEIEVRQIYAKKYGEAVRAC